MKKNILKKTAILCAVMFASEIVKVFAYDLSDFIITRLLLGYHKPYIFKINDILIDAVMAVASLVIYYVIGRKVFAKFSSEEKKYSSIIISTLIVIIYTMIVLRSSNGTYFKGHIILDSSISYIIGSFLYSVSDTFSWKIITVVLSPVSILLIWMFSKIKKEQHFSFYSKSEYRKILSKQYYTFKDKCAQKNVLKKTVILSVSLFAVEIVNYIVSILIMEWSASFVEQFHDAYKIRDNVISVVIDFISLIMYFIIGRIVFVRFSSEEKKYSAIIVSALIIISYPASMLLTYLTGDYYIVHMELCSPLCAYLVYPLRNIYGLYEILYTIFSPISVVLVWLFSKIGKKKQIEDSNKHGTAI